jgi:hypothetical protein
VKVLFVCPFVPWPLVNGGKIRTFHLIKAASERAELHVRLIREPGTSAEAEAAIGAHCASLSFFDRERPGPWVRWSRARLERWFFSPALQAALAHDVATGGFDLVHLDELLLARIVNAGGVRVVQHHHKLDTVLYDTLNANRGPHRYFDLWKLRRLEADSARRTRFHVTCSEEDGDVLRARYPGIVCRAVPSGFDPLFFRAEEPAPPRDPLELCFLGSMDYGPNVDGVRFFVAECMPRLRERHPGVRLTIVGGNPAPEVRALEHADVAVTGVVPDVRPYLLRAGQMVVPLRIGGGTRLKIVEALALGTPVTSTAIGAEGLALEPDRDLRIADGAAALVDAIGRSIADPAGARALGEHGRRTVHARYRWDALGARLVGCWEEMLQLEG